MNECINLISIGIYLGIETMTLTDQITLTESQKKIYWSFRSPQDLESIKNFLGKSGKKVMEIGYYDTFLDV